MEVHMRNLSWLVAAGIVAIIGGCAALSNSTSSPHGYDRYRSAYASENPYYYAGKYYYRPGYPASAMGVGGRDANQDGVADHLQR
jgi:hypothetical protein